MITKSVDNGFTKSTFPMVLNNEATDFATTN